MSKKSTKAFIAVAVLLILLPTPGLSITNCIQQHKTSSTKECSICFESRKNSFGTCSAFRNNPGCIESNSVSPTACTKCKPAYSLNGGVCQVATNPINNCVSHVLSPSNPNCQECSNGIPASDLKSCAAFSTASGGDAPFLADCARGVKPSIYGSTRCKVCNNGFAFETSTDKCASTTATGCWRMTNGVCINCRAWDGYFSDGYDDSASGQPIFCRTLNDQTPWITRGVAKDLADVYAQLTNLSRADILPSSVYTQSSWIGYVDFKDGYLAYNYSTFFPEKNFITNTTSGTGFTQVKKASFELNSDQKLPFYDYFTNAGIKENNREIFKCFFEKRCA